MSLSTKTARKAILRKSWLKRGKPIARTPMRKRKPSAKKVERSMGSPTRRKWVQRLPCVGCGLEGHSVNAHVAKDASKGMGHKAGHRCIAPLCDAGGNNCHDRFDQWLAPYDNIVSRAPVIARAAIVAAQWDAIQERSA